MIYSKKLGSYIPVNVFKTVFDMSDGGNLTRYLVKDDKIPIGIVDLTDKEGGIFVQMIKKFNCNYSKFGNVADRIEVEHCLKRGLSDFTIDSEAALNSHALHYLRGKRFIPEGINETVKQIIESTPTGEQYNTCRLGAVKMYMPKELIQKYIEIIKKCPLLK